MNGDEEFFDAVTGERGRKRGGGGGGVGVEPRVPALALTLGMRGRLSEATQGRGVTGPWRWRPRAVSQLWGEAQPGPQATRKGSWALVLNRVALECKYCYLDPT